MQHDHEVKVTIPEELRARVAKVNQYLQSNKTVFLVGAGCFAAGYLVRKQPETTMIINNVTPNITPVFALDKLPIE